ncbi:MAG: peptidoglycan-associated lipoprotein Pal [Gammaproteobacteria bacterium]|nr:peptidoglycan-associated lipoprotein Pal [Gammaproteobacteria bacterium]MDH3415474.1 peptidoglycan-associated lipoprotein Pal [Gammaproteobacteria bacterium]
MPQFKLILASLLVALLAGCSSPTLPDPDPSETGYGESGSGADTDGYDSDGLGEGEFVDFDPSGGELASILYFEFDSSELRADDTETVTRHARQLAENANLKVRLEGHADERGSREYNIGLGERRSQTVRRMLLIQGASASQISTVSFGEERPAAFGSTEDAYSQNRRVEINYTN